jgi:mannose-6-phosphate isomerase-like protein (cupin superfamily)
MTKTHQALGRKIPIAPTVKDTGMFWRISPPCSVRSTDRVGAAVGSVIRRALIADESARRESRAARLCGPVEPSCSRVWDCPAHREGQMAMNRAEFEADLRREGYELREGKIEPNVHRDAHAHEFDARLLVLEGSVTLVFGTDRCTYGPGDSCSVPAGTMHEEHTDAEGVRFLAGRRPPAKPATEE